MTWVGVKLPVGEGQVFCVWGSSCAGPANRPGDGKLQRQRSFFETAAMTSLAHFAFYGILMGIHIRM